MTLTTERLVLRPWREDDAAKLYEYAKDPRVGPSAGWPVHTSVENSRDIIENVLSEEGTFAVTLKDADEPIGSIGIFSSDIKCANGEPEIGYWIAVPFWGQGYIPEAVHELLRRAFEEQGAQRVWCSHFDGNDKSRRVIEKCGFHYVANEQTTWAAVGKTFDTLCYSIDRGKWLKVAGK